MLVVDDSVDGARTLSTLLKIWGHTTRVAHDGPEAIEVASAFRPGLVFLDIGLPGMDGYEVCRQLRDEVGLTNTKFVALTRRGSDQDKKLGRDAGFSLHLVKPIDPDAIETILKEAVEGESAR